MNYYDSIADGYNALHGDEQEKKMAIVHTLLKTEEDDMLLDVGCGTGISSNFLCNVVGVDPSFGLLKKYSGNAFMIQATAEYLPFKEKSFDKIISLTAAQNFSDMHLAIGEIGRVLMGDAVVTALKKSEVIPKLRGELSNNLKILSEILEDKDIIFHIGTR